MINGNLRDDYLGEGLYALNTEKFASRKKIIALSVAYLGDYSYFCTWKL